MSNKNQLTQRQQEIFDLICKCILTTGAPPTRVEIAEAFGFKSPNAAEDHLQALARKGVIELISGTSRGIRLTADDASDIYNAVVHQQNDVESLCLPLVGRVAAGMPILAQEHVDRTYQVEASLFKSKPDYLLKVRGMSMCDIGIIDGDLLAVKKTAQAHNGEIVVARIDDEVTVKRYEKTATAIILKPENSDFSPIVVTEANSFAIEGLVIGLIRNQLN